MSLTTAQKQDLSKQIDKSRHNYIIDGYTMSIGELVSMYRDEEFEINPDATRPFYWSPQQRSRLIKSVLIGIPLPSIFVYQNDNGVWELIDGVQRMSSIFEFLGELKNEKNEKVMALELVKTSLFPSFGEITWLDLPNELKLDFKRFKIETKIIRNISGDKLELIKLLRNVL
jgi:uncharacterized protein with ParB-like and HNH nuclease domain